jgi:hypothetical protein
MIVPSGSKYFAAGACRMGLPNNRMNLTSGDLLEVARADRQPWRRARLRFVVARRLSGC